MSMLWAPKNLREAPAYVREEHDLINVLDDTVEGEMTVKLDQIRDFFYHPPKERRKFDKFFRCGYRCQ
ncbi:hypothetical protein Hdeb2414_s0014g00430501 [Helianthus debilis subsp. tardiflorus]